MLILCVVQFIARRDITLLTTIYLPILMIPVFFTAFIPAWKKAVRLKEEHGWQVSNILLAGTSSPQTRGSLSAVPWIWYLLSFVIVAATFVVAITRYPALPDMIAGHLNENMQPTRWVEKTWCSVLMMPLFTAATLALMVMVAVFIEKAKLQIDPAKPRLSFAQHGIYRRRMGHAMGFLTLIVILFMAIVGLPFIFPDSPVWGAQIFWGSMVLISIPIILVSVVQLKTGQGGCKVKIDIDEDNKTDQESGKSGVDDAGKASDDKFWKLGMFYCNPDDPTFIVENRFGMKLGFNYSRLPVKIGVAIVLFGLIAMYAWLMMLILTAGI